MIELFGWFGQYCLSQNGYGPSLSLLLLLLLLLLMLSMLLLPLRMLLPWLVAAALFFFSFF